MLIQHALMHIIHNNNATVLGFHKLTDTLNAESLINQHIH